MAAYIRNSPEEYPFPKDFEYAFASLAPILDELRPEVKQSLAPLPEFIGLPRMIVEDPTSAGRYFEARLSDGPYQSGPDGVALLGPFGKIERVE